MSNSLTDLRIQKTRKALCDAFITMLSEKSFDNITVRDLCDRAMIRRATFYKHFADKYDFFAYFVRHIQESFLAKHTADDFNKGPHSYFIHLLKDAIQFFNTHETLVNSAINSTAFPTLFEILSDEIYRNIIIYITDSPYRKEENSISNEILATFYTGGLVRVLKLWIKNKEILSEDFLINELQKIYCCLDQMY